MPVERGDHAEPSREQVRRVLSGLAAGRLTAVQASDWAGQWVGSDLEVEDDLVWDAIQILHGADMPVPSGEYLYGPLDFRSWLDDFDAQAKAGS